MTLPSYRSESVYSVSNRFIPTAAMLGGIIIGLLTILGDLLNVFGSSTGILLSVTILYGYYEKLTNKKGGCCWTMLNMILYQYLFVKIFSHYKIWIKIYFIFMILSVITTQNIILFKK